MIIGYSYQSFRWCPLPGGMEMTPGGPQGPRSRAGITGFSPLGQRVGWRESLLCGPISAPPVDSSWIGMRRGQNIQWAGQALQGAATLVAVLN